MSEITQVITALPVAPDPDTMTPTEFAEAAAAYVLAQRDLPTELNTFGEQVNVVGAEISANAVNVAADAVIAGAAAAAAAAASNATEWISGGPFVEGDVRWSPIDHLSYRCKVGNSGTTDPSIDSTNWAALVSASSIRRVSRTSNTIITSANQSNLIDITSGTFTQAFDSPSDLGDGLFCYVQNSGSGDITIAASDGVTNWIMYPGEMRLFYSDATTLRSFVLKSFYKTFTASADFVKPPGYASFQGLMWGGGSSGKRSGGAGEAYGGAGGGCFPFVASSAIFSTTEAVVIGAGGAAVSTAADGNAGGASSIGSLFKVWPGATWSTGGSAGYAAGTSGSITTGLGFEGRPLGTAIIDTLYGGTASAGNANAASGNSVYGGAAGGAVSGAGTTYAGGTSRIGGSGGAGGDSTNGTDGTAPGGGGGATRTGTLSGAGARGEVRIWGVAA